MNLDQDKLPGRVVVGLGTGRCGTTSLHRLFKAQPSTRSTHEIFGPNHPWDAPESEMRDLVARFLHSAPGSDVLADVSFAWLPYVDMLREACARNGVDVRFLCLQRDMAGYVASMSKWLRGKNHFIEYDPEDPRYIPCKNGWEKCYPKYVEPRSNPLSSQLERYWREYNAEAYFQASDHDDFDIFHTDALNSAEGVYNILKHAGYADPDMVLLAGIKTNSSHGL